MQEIQNVQSHGVHYSFMDSIIFSFILFLCVCKLAKLINLSSLLNILAKTFSKLILEQNFVNAICYLMWGKKSKYLLLQWSHFIGCRQIISKETHFLKTLASTKKVLNQSNKIAISSIPYFSQDSQGMDTMTQSNQKRPIFEEVSLN